MQEREREEKRQPEGQETVEREGARGRVRGVKGRGRGRGVGGFLVYGVGEVEAFALCSFTGPLGVAVGWCDNPISSCLIRQVRLRSQGVRQAALEGLVPAH